jgi:glycosyltransferase involved in cell wall biosynthesis
MRIGINALYLLPGQVGGSETYLRKLIDAMQRLDGDDEFVVYTNRENAGTFSLSSPRFRESPIAVSAGSRVARIVAEQTLLPRQVRRDRIDVLHSPGNTAPLWASCPGVTTLLDVGYRFFPEDWSTAGRIANEILIPAMNRRVTRIITISESSKREIVEAIGVAPTAIDVIYLGIDGNVASAGSAEQTAVRGRLRIDGDFLLAVSGTHPHKNLDGLLRIYERFSRERTSPPALVIVGVRGTHQARIERLAGAARGRVILTGWLADVELGALYRSARLLVFPSLYEGFGLPPLEAMSVGLPVVSSNTTSLPEVVGAGGVLVDPRDEAAVAAAIERTWTDEALRGELIERGYAQAKRFTWAETARKTLSVLRAASSS